MSEQDLHEIDWVPIPNEPYIIRYAFTDTYYYIIISNLTLLYGEKLIDYDIQERFRKLNPYAQMKSQVILENLKKSLQKGLSGKLDLSMKSDTNKLVITLKFPVAHVLCSYDIEMDLMEADKVMEYVICPTVFGALLSQRKVMELQMRALSESAGLSKSSNISASTQNIIEPEWLRGQNVPIETLLDSFLKVQSHFKDLYVENSETYSLLRNEKRKKSAQSTTPQKKCSLQDNNNDEATSFKFEDAEENISIKMEDMDDTLPTDASSTTSLQASRTNVKKKKTFKI